MYNMKYGVKIHVSTCSLPLSKLNPFPVITLYSTLKDQGYFICFSLISVPRQLRFFI